MTGTINGCIVPISTLSSSGATSLYNNVRMPRHLMSLKAVNPPYYANAALLYIKGQFCKLFHKITVN